MEQRELDKTIESMRIQNSKKAMLGSLRYVGLPMYLSFSAIDYIFQPNQAFKWFIYRVIFCLFVLVLNEMLRKQRFERFTRLIAIAIISTAALAINVMIAQSGGYSSAYLTAILFITSITCTVLKVSLTDSIIIGLLTHGVTTGIIYYSAGLENWESAVVASSFQVGMWILLVANSFNDHQWIKEIAHEILVKQSNIDKSSRTDFLKKYFPKILREDVESGKKLDRRKVMDNAVIGFLDLSGSTRFGTKISAELDWDIKEKFLDSVIARAEAYDIIVLNFLGDGAPFIANYHENNKWKVNLLSFFEDVTHDWRRIQESYSGSLSIDSAGVKCGVAIGEACVGFIGNTQAYFSLTGNSVNLAARLCSRSAPNEMMASGRVWETLANRVISWNSQKLTLTDLGGMEGIPVTAVRLQKDTVHDNELICKVCGSKLIYAENNVYQITLSCPNGHEVS